MQEACLGESLKVSMLLCAGIEGGLLWSLQSFAMTDMIPGGIIKYIKP